VCVCVCAHRRQTTIQHRHVDIVARQQGLKEEPALSGIKGEFVSIVAGHGERGNAHMSTHMHTYT
jgi:hypothetical protein